MRWPENSPSSLLEAMRLGAHMIEFDLRLSKDGEPVVFHDHTVDRITTGQGLVEGLNISELKELRFKNCGEALPDSERILTFHEALDLFPCNVWLNVHLKGMAERPSLWNRLSRRLRASGTKTRLARIAARQVMASGRQHQVLLTCGGAFAVAAREVDEQTQICYVVRGNNSRVAVDEAIDQQAQFVQLSDKCPYNPELVQRLKRSGLMISYCFGDSLASARQLLDAGVNFPLTNHIDTMMAHASELGLSKLD